MNEITSLISLSGVTRDIFGLDAALMGTLFVTQWILVLQILWITAIVIPFTIMSIIFYLIDWLILDKITSFLLSGNWENSTNIVITATSPILIMLYVGLFFGFIFLIIFFINYFGRNAFGLQASEIIKRLYWLFGLILFIVAIPFAFLFLGFVMKFITSLITNVINPKGFNNTFLDIDKFKNALISLNSYQDPNLLDQTIWDEKWNSIKMTPELTNLKNQLFNTFNNLSTELNKYNFNRSINLVLQNINNPEKLQEIFTNTNLDSLNKISNLASQYQYVLDQVQQTLSVAEFENISQLLGSYNTVQQISSFNINLAVVIQNGTMYQNLELNNYGEIVIANNIGFMIYYALTGIYVNSINGIWNSLSFLSCLLQSGGFANLIKSIVLGSMVALATAKGIAQLMTILIYRWYAILALIPYGAFSTVRYVNDNGSIFKLWIRETITVFASLFVVGLNLQILNLLYSIISNAFDSGAIDIKEISGNSVYLSIAFIIFVVISIYACVGFTNKVLEIFNQSSINKDAGMQALAHEYASAVSKQSNKKSNIRRSASSIRRNITNKNTLTGKAVNKFKNRKSRKGI